MIKDIENDPDMQGSRRAIIRASRRAAEIAKQHNQPLILWKDGKIVKVPVDELPPLPEEAAFEKELR